MSHPTIDTIALIEGFAETHVGYAIDFTPALDRALIDRDWPRMTGDILGEFVWVEAVLGDDAEGMTVGARFTPRKEADPGREEIERRAAALVASWKAARR